jgi:anti-sigma B factor antagonist
MTEPFRIDAGPADPRATCLRVFGRLDSASADQLARRCAQVRSEGRNLVLNLEQVSFVASSGVGALLAVAEQFRDSGSELRLAALSPAVDSVIRLLNLDQFLEIQTSEDDAFASLKAA